MASARSHGVTVRRGGRDRASVFPGWRALGAQVVLVVLAALCYFGVRGLTRSREGPAQEHARDLLSVERALGIDGERWLQDRLIDHDRLVDAANAVYMYGHWPVIAITLAVLFTRAPDRYSFRATLKVMQIPMPR